MSAKFEKQHLVTIVNQFSLVEVYILGKSLGIRNCLDVVRLDPLCKDVFDNPDVIVSECIVRFPVTGDSQNNVLNIRIDRVTTIIFKIRINLGFQTEEEILESPSKAILMVTVISIGEDCARQRIHRQLIIVLV